MKRNYGSPLTCWVCAAVWLASACAAEQFMQTLTARHMQTNGGQSGRTIYRDGQGVGVGRLDTRGYAHDAVVGLRDLEVDVEPCGLLARTTVRHVFYNETPATLEGVFTFNLPAGAVVDRFAMTIQSEDDLMEASLLDRGQARNIYREIVYGVRRDPGVLEMLDARTFQATIFPIFSKRTKTIVLSYVTPLVEHAAPDGSGEWLYRYPLLTSSGVRSDALPPAARVRLRFHMAQAPEKLEPKVTMDMQSIREPNGALTLGTQFKGDEIGTDWMVAWPQRPDENVIVKGCVVQAHRATDGVPGAFLLRVAPPAPAVEGPHDVLVLWDTSASRTEQELAAGRACILSLLNALQPKDRFAIVAFDTTVRTCSSGLLSPTLPSLSAARSFLLAQRPLGATDIGGAFEVLSRLCDGQTLNDPRVVCIGSGDATQGLRGEALERKVSAALKKLGAEVYPIWPGAGQQGDPKEAPACIAKAALRPVLILPEILATGDVGARLRATFDNPFHSASLSVKTSDGSVAELLQVDAAELWDGKMLETPGQYRHGGPALVELVCAGKTGARTFHWQVDLPAIEAGNVAVERLWAHRSMLRMEKEGNANSARQLSLQHHVLGPQTAFLVLESEKMYRDYRVDRGERDAQPEADVRSRLLAGVPSWSPARDVAAAPGWLKQVPAVTAGAHADRLDAFDMDGTPVHVSLSNVTLYPDRNDLVDRHDRHERRDSALTPAKLAETRLGLSAKIAECRFLPFEPETVFSQIWFSATWEALQHPERLASQFGADADTAVWNLVKERAKAPTTETIEAGHSASVYGGRELTLWAHLLDVRQPSALRIARDARSIEVDTHQFAQHLLSSILYAKNPQWVRSSKDEEIDRAIRTRMSLTYDLRNVPPERLVAAWNFLAQLMLVEGRPAKAAEAARQALAKAYNTPARLTLLLNACASIEQANFKKASVCWQELCGRARPEVEGLDDLLAMAFYRSALMGGEDAQVAEAFERFGRSRMPNSVRFYQDLARMLIEQNRPEDAVRAVSSILEFRSPATGKDLDIEALWLLPAE